MNYMWRLLEINLEEFILCNFRIILVFYLAYIFYIYAKQCNTNFLFNELYIFIYLYRNNHLNINPQ